MANTPTRSDPDARIHEPDCLRVEHDGRADDARQTDWVQQAQEENLARALLCYGEVYPYAPPRREFFEP
jgi:hypothetical protein